MAIEIPGLSLSILRQETSTQAGKPVLIGGRFTAFGIGVPGLIRVYLEGPSYNPEVRTFDAFAQPFSGDWSVQVVTEKDGQYDLYARAYLVPAIPSGPAFPENLLLLPPIAESTKPPLVVGAPAPGGVSAQTPEGAQFLETPAQTPIELMTTVGAPSIFVGAPQISVIPAAPEVAPAAPTPTIPPTIIVEAPTPSYIPSIPEAPPAVSVGEYFPPVAELPELEVPELPEVTALQIPTFPTTPTAGMIGIPYSNLPGQLNVGDTLTGNVQVPTVIPQVAAGFQQLLPGAPELPAYQLRSYIILEGPDGQTTTVASQSASIQLGQPFYLPVNFPTTGMKEGRYNVYLRIADYSNRVIFNQVIAHIYLVALPPVPSLVTAAAPTLPTSAMFGTPSLNAPSSINLGETWTGSLSIPTTYPSGLPTPPALPVYPVTLVAELESPQGQRFTAGQLTPSFQPGQRLSLPLSVDTSRLPGEGNYNVLLSMKDMQGNSLLPSGMPTEVMGRLQVLAAALAAGLPGVPTPELPKGVPSLSQFTNVKVSLSPTTAKVGDYITIPVTYTHVGAPESRSLRGSVGQQRVEFDEICWNETTISVPLDAVPQTRTTNVRVLLTSAISPGTYGIQGKIVGTGPLSLIGQAASPAVYNIITVTRAITESTYTNVSVRLTPRTAKIGDTVTIPVTYTHIGAGDTRTVRASIGQQRGTFDEICWNETTITTPTDESAVSRTVNVPVRITSAISPGTYGIQGKVAGTGLFGTTGQAVSPTVYNVLQITAAAPAIGPSYIPRIDVQLSPTSVQIGGTLRIPFSYQHSGEAERVTVYGAIGQRRGGFDEILHNSQSLSIPLDSTLTSRTGSISIPITSAIAAGRTYGVQVKIQRTTTGRGEVISPAVYDVVTIPAAAAPPAARPTATASPTTAQPGQSVTISYSGFQPNSTIYTSTRTIGTVNGRASSQGSGTIRLSLPSTLPAGTYNTAVTDSYGHSATAQFTVQAAAAPPAAPSLQVTNQPSTGGNIVFRFSGFQPNSQVTVGVQGGGSAKFTADSTGAGYQAIGPISERAGSYTLVATDNYGHRATAPFTVR